MKLSEYQNEAQKTDVNPVVDGKSDDVARLIPILGLAGEAGELLTEYKKLLRDGPGHTQFKARVNEELGDILWYVANVARKFGLNLDDIALSNLEKVRSLYGPAEGAEPLDSSYAANERFPRRFTATFREVQRGQRLEVLTEIDGVKIGAALTDNAYFDDGYRYHDVFHLAYAAHLGWSPVLRSLLRLKRRSSPLIDEVEDGGRSAVIEEGIAALVFDYARKHNFLEGIKELDESLLFTIHGMSAHLEVASRPASSWRDAILDGFSAWRMLIRGKGGQVLADLDERRLCYSPLLDSATATAAADTVE